MRISFFCRSSYFNQIFEENKRAEISKEALVEQSLNMRVIPVLAKYINIIL